MRKTAFISSLIVGILLVFLPFLSQAQLISQGQLYNDRSKLADDISEILEDSITKTDIIHGLEIANIFSDELIQGGQILFGDPISELSNKVLHEIISKNKLNISNVNVYTLRWTSLEAFSLSNRNIYISVGLTERFESIDELAFVIAHELSHLVHAHSVLYDEGSGFAREQENQADNDAMMWLANAGFNGQRSLYLLDRLNYRHVAYREFRTAIRQLEDSVFKLPKRVLLSEVKPIKPVEEYYSSFHTHPVLSERKKKLKKEEVSDTKSPFSDQLAGVVKKARIEMCELLLLELNYPAALYQSFLCEQDYPEEKLPRKVRAYVFYGTYRLALDSRRSRCLRSDKIRYGEEERLYFLLEQATLNDLFVLAVRETWLGYRNDPDSFYLAISDHLIAGMEDEGIDPKTFSRERTVDEKIDTAGLSTMERIKRRRESMKMTAYRDAFVPIFAIDAFESSWSGHPVLAKADSGSTTTIVEGSIIYPDSVAYALSNVELRKTQRRKFRSYVREVANRYDLPDYYIPEGDTLNGEDYNSYQGLRDYIREIRNYDRTTEEEGLRQIPFSYLIHPGSVSAGQIAVPTIFLDPGRRNFNPFFLVWSGCMVYPIPWYVVWQSSVTLNMTYRMEWYNTNDHLLESVEWVETRSRFRKDVIKSRLYYSITKELQ